jgi:hypothetical protein
MDIEGMLRDDPEMEPDYEGRVETMENGYEKWLDTIGGSR